MIQCTFDYNRARARAHSGFSRVGSDNKAQSPTAGLRDALNATLRDDYGAVYYVKTPCENETLGTYVLRISTRS